MATKLVHAVAEADTVRIEWRSHITGWRDLHSANIYLLSVGPLSSRLGGAMAAVMEFENAFDDTSYRLVYVTGNTGVTTLPMTATKLVSVLCAWGLVK